MCERNRETGKETERWKERETGMYDARERRVGETGQGRERVRDIEREQEREREGGGEAMI